MSLTQNQTYFSAALIALILICLTPIGRLLESSMPLHVLVEIPLLVIIGIVFAVILKDRVSNALNLFNRGGITGILIATFVFAFWMIPRWLDASLNNDNIAIIKYVSLPLGVGVPLAWSWQRLHPIARSVVKIEFLTMLYRLGWLYLISPKRLCNSYAINDQELLGQGFLIIALALSITWLIPVFFGNTTIKAAT